MKSGPYLNRVKILNLQSTQHLLDNAKILIRDKMEI